MDIIEKFYKKLDNSKTKVKKSNVYSQKCVRVKTKMIQHWKENKNTPKTKNKHVKIPLRIKLKKNKKIVKKRALVPQSIRRLKKWNHPRIEKDTFENLINDE